MKLLGIVIVVMVLSGCQNDVRHYKAPSETKAPLSIAYLNARTSGFTWPDLPGWRTVEPGSAFIKLRLEKNDQVLTVSSIGGDGGGLLRNVNRWRGQLQLPAVTSLLDDVTRVQRGHHAYDVVTLRAGTSMHVAVFSTPTETWYIKLIGPKGLDLADFNMFLTDFEVLSDH